MIHYRNARIFTAAEPGWAESMVVDDGRLQFVGDDATAAAYAPEADVVDLGGAFVLPGFIDAHTHLVPFGESLGHVDLMGTQNLDEIGARVRAAVAADPGASRIVGRNWLATSIPGRIPDRHMIDEMEADRPVYLDAFDSHSMWVNTAALRELGVDDDTPDPIGGRIARAPETGAATGMLYETASLNLATHFLTSTVTDDDRDRALRLAFSRYLAAGVTAAVDMGLRQADLECLERQLDQGNGTLPIRVAAHWLVDLCATEAENVAQVRHAADLAKRHDGPWFRVAGIKIMVDGVIDSCTAAMKLPYADGSHCGPIWSLEALGPVVAAADAAGLQVAMHAIGDDASDIALSAIEYAQSANGPIDRRHRIEHLETVTPENVRRLASLGVVASMQPVHADPAIIDNWRDMLGDDRADRGMPWPEITSAGGVLAFGTDAPTAPHAPLPNMYVATTRYSALVPGLGPNIGEFALPMAEALAHGTKDAAFACRWDELTGQLVAGKAADFIVLDRDPFTGEEAELLRTNVISTYVAGTRVPCAS
ncbi:amidohydrolase [Mycobacterium sp. NPDC006124]|uniref:amidohydrolase n=1 Tax=Mycobacterium sp. NPDC006124 TaxID=3156729 RepID=UPI0033AC0D9F